MPGAAPLAAFCRRDESEREFTAELRQILEVIAWTGNYWHEWSMLKCLLLYRLKQVLTQYNECHTASGGQQAGETLNDLKGQLLEALDLFVDGPPFTLQRLCELLLNPQVTYPNIDKASLAFEKLLLVTSTVPICKDPYPSFPESKGQLGCSQSVELQQAIDAGANGAPEGEGVVDEVMVEVIYTRQMDEASLSSSDKTLSLGNEDNHSLLPDSRKGHMLSGSPLLDEDLVDISLDDERSITEV